MMSEKKKIIVRITDGKHTYEEDVTEDQKEYYGEISTNGANPEMNDVSFEQWTRPVKENLMEDNSLDKYNTRDKSCHFIFGWMECFSQGDDVPEWMHDAKELTIEVLNRSKVK